ncbi:MAG: hypothetical protein GC164_12540 [Phycisphaera sp.]|nr:hypothetical protein [Phycisphaera sp.]
MTRRFCLSLMGVALFATVSRAMFMPPELAPVDRLVAKATKYIEAHPDDADGQYTLGRIHYLAYTQKSRAVPSFEFGNKPEGSKPDIPADWAIYKSFYQQQALEAEAKRLADEELAKQGLDESKDGKAYARAFGKHYKALQDAHWQPPEPPAEELDHHAQEAVRCFLRAVEMKPDNALYHIGLASIREEYARRAGELGLEPTSLQVVHNPVQKFDTQRWLEASLNSYMQAYELSAKRDAALDTQPIAGITSLVSHGAAQGALRVAKLLPDGALDDKTQAKLTAHLDKLKDLPIGAVTPIVFDMNQTHDTDQLRRWLEGGEIVNFDLDGDGLAEQRHWPRAGTCLLVWDPMHTGRVTSGRQLFGNVTWWLFWNDGFGPLAMLDDNGDGELTGPEMRGLSVWCDANGNAVSDPGEVVPIENTPIVSLSVHALSSADDAHQSPANPTGLRLRDGRELPVYDWIAPAAGTDPR